MIQYLNVTHYWLYSCFISLLFVIYIWSCNLSCAVKHTIKRSTSMIDSCHWPISYVVSLPCDTSVVWRNSHKLWTPRHIGIYVDSTYLYYFDFFNPYFQMWHNTVSIVHSSCTKTLLTSAAIFDLVLLFLWNIVSMTSSFVCTYTNNGMCSVVTVTWQSGRVYRPLVDQSINQLF